MQQRRARGMLKIRRRLDDEEDYDDSENDDDVNDNEDNGHHLNEYSRYDEEIIQSRVTR